MMADVIETVKDHCKHEDCIYRISIARTALYCGYMEKEFKPRNCKISECDKYMSGKRDEKRRLVF